MKKLLACSALIVFFAGFKPISQSHYVYESDNLKIEKLSENLYVHVSYLKTDDFGKVACNGAIYFDGDQVIVLDTPTDDSTSVELIRWIQVDQKKSIKAVVATHFHEDCLGGLQEFHKNGIPSYANKLTIDLLGTDNESSRPQTGFEKELKLKLNKQTILLKHFGEGHTRDNIIAHIPAEKAIFGGCLIKSMKAGKGYLGDANVSEWSNTVEAIKIELPELSIVIPGHGRHGGTELLDYTIGMFRE